MRSIVAFHAGRLASILLALLAWSWTAAAPARSGIWVFDRAPSYPGVVMMELARDGRSGTLTTSWYGAIPMQGLRPAAGGVAFTIRNLNDPAHPVRRWTARFAGNAVRLTGDLWHAHVEQVGHPGTPAQGRARAFHPVALPPAPVLAPNGQAATPPMGWSSWNRFADHIDDRTVRTMADVLVATGLRDAGYRYVNIDDGWQGTRDAAGRLRPNSRFPDMAALAAYVHARGLKLGLYSSPGLKTCAGYPGSYGHVAQDARTFAAWGIDYLKYDLCSGEWFYADADGVRRAYAVMGAALRATGRPILFSLCEYGRFDVGRWGRQVGGHLWRTTGDIEDNYASMLRNLDRDGRPEDAGPGGWNDPDMLEIGNGGLSPAEARTHMVLWAMAAAPLLMGHDLRRTDPAALALLTDRDLLAIDQDRLGAQGRLVRRDGAVELWRKPLGDGRVALALINRGTVVRPVTITAADTGLDRAATLRAVGPAAQVAGSGGERSVPPHDAVVLLAEPGSTTSHL